LAVEDALAGWDRVAGELDPLADGIAVSPGLGDGRGGHERLLQVALEPNPASSKSWTGTSELASRAARSASTSSSAGRSSAGGRAFSRPISRLASEREVALSVATELEQRAEQADNLRRTHVERARYEAELARRRYLAVDPHNRLVANALEADWNEKLRSLTQAQDNYEHARENGNGPLSEQQRAKVMALASDFPRLWNDPATPQHERKRMVRLLIEDVTLGRDQQITTHVRLKGGQTHTLTLPLPPPVWQTRQTNPDTFKLIDQLLDDHTDAQTAELINHAGRRTGTGQPFTALSIIRLRQDHSLPSHRDRLRERGLLTVAETAKRLGVTTSTIKNWHTAGLLTGHKANERNELLYEPPDEHDPRLRKHIGWRLKNRQPNQSTPGGAV
jgi:hypothetical protein